MLYVNVGDRDAMGEVTRMLVIICLRVVVDVKWKLLLYVNECDY